MPEEAHADVVGIDRQRNAHPSAGPRGDVQLSLVERCAVSQHAHRHPSGVLGLVGHLHECRLAAACRIHAHDHARDGLVFGAAANGTHLQGRGERSDRLGRRPGAVGEQEDLTASLGGGGDLG